MTRFRRTITQGATKAPTWAALLDDLTAEWLVQVAQTDGVRAAGRRAAHALARLTGLHPAEAAHGWPTLTAPGSAEGIIRVTGIGRADLERGLAELTAARLLVNGGEGGMFVLFTPAVLAGADW